VKKSQLKSIIRECIEEMTYDIEEGGGSRKKKSAMRTKHGSMKDVTGKSSIPQINVRDITKADLDSPDDAPSKPMKMPKTPKKARELTPDERMIQHRRAGKNPSWKLGKRAKDPRDVIKAHTPRRIEK